MGKGESGLADRYKYSAFISYSHADEKMAAWLHRALEKYRVPKNLVGQETGFGKIPKKLKAVFRDRDELSAATNLSQSIRRAMKQSRSMIVLCSPAAVKSTWVNKEISEFIKLRGRENILCLIVEGTPGGQSECFPSALFSGLSKARKKTFEPIAADARAEGDGKRLAKLKLISGLLGLELDTLIQREAHRRQVRQWTGLGVSLTLITVLSVLLFLAIEARKEAEEARIFAEQKRAQAEELVDFMMGELKTRLEPIGSLQLMDNIAMQALGYYASMDLQELDDEALSRRAEVLLMMGNIEYHRGNSELARDIYHQAFLTTEELLSQNPDDPKRIFDHSQSVFYLGDLSLGRGNLDQAAEYFRVYAEYAARLADMEPDNLDYQYEVGYAHSNLGAVFNRQGRFLKAEKEFQKQMEIFQSLAAASPDSEDLKYEVAQSMGWQASAQLAAGKLRQAKSSRLEELQIYQQILSQNPQNLKVRMDVLVVHQTLGAIHTYLGEVAEGIENFEEGIEIAENLMATDPENALFKEIFTRLVLDYTESGALGLNPKQNPGILARAFELARTFHQRDEDNFPWALLYYRTLVHQARVHIREGQAAQAAELAQKAGTGLKALWVKNPGAYSILTSLGMAALTQAEALEKQQPPEPAEPVLAAFIETAEPHQNRLKIRARDFLARAWFLTGFEEKTRENRDFFKKIGYSPPDFQLFWENPGH